jgi:hypothetical protein
VTTGEGPPPGPAIPRPSDGLGDTRDHSARADDRKPRWITYADVFGRPASAIIAALTIGFISVLGQGLIEQQQRARVYTELLSQREQAESSIRKDMFVTILEKFFSGVSPDSANVHDQLVRLEVLALNFSETLSLSPLFRELDHAINREGAYRGFMSRVDWAEDRRRLHGLAKRVNGWQLSRLAVAGEIFEFEVPLAEIQQVGGAIYEFPDLALEGVSRDYRITLSNPQPTLNVVDVAVQIVTNAAGESDARPTERSFSLSYYDFPLIDNTRLSHNQRFAIVLSDFESEFVRVEAVVFPGAYATQREAPTLRAIIEGMQGGDEQPVHRH